MSRWPKYPSVYEINAWVWLNDLSEAGGKPLTLDGVPQAELERIAGYGFDAVWLMGVWERSPGARQVSRSNPEWQAEFRHFMPDYTEQDVVGSPYAIYDYRVDPSLGGDEELAALRARLRESGMLLMLDFVPNHLALDHAWLTLHPERFVQGTNELLQREPQNYFAHGEGAEARVFAHGRDPYFDGWPDTAQLDYRRPETRESMTDALLSVAAKCDGARCDMAMLLTREVFRRTWGGEFEPHWAEFWPEAVARLKAARPDFLLLAEVYWDLEYELQQQGFDYTYDKRLYDRLQGDDAPAVRAHLGGGFEYQSRLARFVENHDERRALEAFGPARCPAVSTLSLTLPGLRLLHEGQLDGWRLKLPVHLGRRPKEPSEHAVREHYRRLLAALGEDIFHKGFWRLLEARAAWDGNPSHGNYLATCWTLEGDSRLVVVNLSPDRAQCYLPLGIDELAGRAWLLKDLLGDARYLRDGDSLLSPGLYLDVPGYGFHLFELEMVSAN
jgi:hypothetical protein